MWASDCVCRRWRIVVAAGCLAMAEHQTIAQPYLGQPFSAPPKLGRDRACVCTKPLPHLPPAYAEVDSRQRKVLERAVQSDPGGQAKVARREVRTPGHRPYTSKRPPLPEEPHTFGVWMATKVLQRARVIEQSRISVTRGIISRPSIAFGRARAMGPLKLEQFYG